MQENSHVHGAPSDAAPVIGTPGRKRPHGRLIDNVRKRGKVSVRHSANSRPFARVRSGIRTGTTAHFAFWMADLKIKSSLQRLKLDSIADSDQPGRVASSIAIIRVNSRLRTVWDLASANVADLLAIPQIGPARLEELEKYFQDRQVKLNWTAA